MSLTSWPVLDTAIALATALVLGAGIGLERQFRQRSAGLRTHVLVAVGAAAFVDLGARVAGANGAARVISWCPASAFSGSG